LSSALKGSEWSAACPTTFPLQKELLAPTEQEAGCGPEWVWMLFRRKHHLPLPGKEPQLLRFPAYGLVIILPMLPALIHFDKRTLMTATIRMTKQTVRTVSLLTTYEVCPESIQPF